MKPEAAQRDRSFWTGAPGEYSLAVAVVAAATLIRYGLGVALGVSPPYLLYFPAVLFVAQRDFRSGILAVLLSALAADYFFIAPAGSLYVSRTGDIVSLSIFVATSVALCLLLLRRRESERQRSAARRSELLVAALTRMGEGLLTCTRAGIITYVNDACAAMLGSDATTLTGQSVQEVLEFVDPDGGLPIRDVLGHLIRGEPLSRQHRHVLLCGRDGRRSAVDVVAFTPPPEDPSGGGILVSFRDFSEHARIKTALGDLNARFEMAANAAGLGFWDRDMKNDTLFWDARMFRMYGRSSTADVAQPYALWAAALHPDDRGVTEQAVAAALKASDHLDVEFRIVRPDGEIRHIHSSAQIIRDGAGTAVRMVGVAFDVTERWLAIEQFRLAVEASPTGMVMADAHGTIVLVNGQTEAAFGYARAELLGQTVEMLLPETLRTDHARHREGFGRAPRARQMGVGLELAGRRKDGSVFPVEVGLNPIVTTHGRYVLSSIIDISEKRRYIANLQAANAALQEQVAYRTQQLRERETLLQEVHHRVKNNLQVISSLLSIQIRSLSDEAGRAPLEECRTRIQTMALIHEKLYQSKDYSRVAFAEYVKGLAANCVAALASSSADVKLQLDLDEVFLSVDQAIPCGLILNELITNSLKHAFADGAGGIIGIAMRNVPDNRVTLTFRDNGRRLPAAPRSDPADSLGMRLVALLVDQLHAEYQLDATEGTVVTLVFDNRVAEA